MLEGLFGFIMSFSYFFEPNYLKDVANVCKKFSIGKIVLFIFLLLLYVILSGGRNIYRVITSKLYSPMTRALTDYFLNPLYLAIYFPLKNDFISKGERNAGYFTVNFILSVLMSICGCIYNEFIILFCFGLEYNTYEQVLKRANSKNEIIEFMEIFDKNDEDDDEI